MKYLEFTHHKNKELHPKGLPVKVVYVTQGDKIPLDGERMDEHNAKQFVNQNPDWYKITEDKPMKGAK